MEIFNRLRFHIIRLLSLKKIKGNKHYDKAAVYLTFDDGPEPGITEFILDELKKYSFKATFFCKGENCVKYPELLNRIREEGHSIANHTFSHISGFQTSCNEYIENVDKCEEFTKNHIFRPPWGELTFEQYIKLSKSYDIVLWDNVSGDTELDKFNLEHYFKSLKSKTRKGDIILFHFCKRHENETMQILPVYLNWINVQGYITKAL